MANKKISDLTAAVPLSFDELIEIVQSGENVQAAISDLLAGVPYMSFDTDPVVPAHQTGLVFWDADSSTFSIMTDVTDVVLQIGQEQFVKVRNNTGSLIPNGAPVYITGALGNRPTVALAQADAVASSRVLGLATADIADNADGYITVFGLVRNLDTSGFLAGDLLYLSQVNPGELVNVEPLAGIISIMGFCIYSHNTNGIILVRIILFN